MNRNKCHEKDYTKTMRRVRAEWEPHNVVLMAFPHEETDWARYEDWEAVTAPFVRTAQAIAYYQMIYMLTRDAAAIKPLFCSTTNIIFIEAEYDDTWTRDYGAISLEEEGAKKLLDFTFDGWGGKFDATRDNAINTFLASKGFLGGTPVESIDYVLEGGSIESDGAGTIMTTSSCLCHPNRNGGLDKKGVEKHLREYLGAQRVLWLDHGTILGDDTDGHIDTLARFVNRDTIAYVTCDNPDDPHYKPLKAMEEQLRTFRTPEGDAYTLVPLPMPAPKLNAEGKRLPATYANFLITNGAVVYPTYKDPNDKKVGEILGGLFPDREIIPIGAMPLIEEGGSIHCSTMPLAF
jgi:agmatine deiminase